LIQHRYSFNDNTAADSVGAPSSTGGSSWTASVGSGASVSYGKLLLPAASNSWLQFPSRILGSSGLVAAVSIEMWVTVASTGNTGYTRLLQFGPSTSNNVNTIGIWLLRDTNELIMNYENWLGNSGQFLIYTGILVPGMQNIHLVLVLYNNAPATLYVNNVAFHHTVNVPILDSSGFYLGYAFDNNGVFSGSFDEFRIWSGALSAVDVSSHFYFGPDQNLGILIEIIMF